MLRDPSILAGVNTASVCLLKHADVSLPLFSADAQDFTLAPLVVGFQGS